MECVNVVFECVGCVMGVRMVEEFLLRMNVSGGVCVMFEEVMEMTTRVGLKMFLNVDAKTRDWSEE